MSKQKTKSPEGGYTQWQQIGDGFCPRGDISLTKVTGPGQFALTGFGMNDPWGVKRIEPTTDEIVRVKDTVSDKIVNQISNFWTLGEKYASHGVTHKRGILLYGPPGTGKTCTTWQVADEVIEKYGAIVIHAGGAVGVLGSVLQSVRQIEPDRKVVVVMEDVEQVLYNGDEESLLDLLDGKQQINGVVYIGTTNYLKKLPSRLRNRPSRFDMVVRIGKPDAALRKAYIQSRRTGLDEETIERWTKDTENLSLAHVKELIISVQVLGLDYAEALGRITEMSKLADKEDAAAEAEECED